MMCRLFGSKCGSGMQNIFFLRQNLIKGDHDHYSNLPPPYNICYHQDFLLHQIHQLWSRGGIITESSSYIFNAYTSSLISYYQLSPNRFRACLIFVQMAAQGEIVLFSKRRKFSQWRQLMRDYFYSSYVGQQRFFFT